MSAATQLMLWIVGVHLVGLIGVAALLLPALREDPAAAKRPSDPGSDEGWGPGPRRPPSPPKRPRGGIPLPDAQSARVRLREPGRLAEQLPARSRRPAREPHRTPVRTGADS
ncbi:MAG: hypothetical protein ACR2LV_06155 [Solirubrobacteraceae bacterium]